MSAQKRWPSKPRTGERCDAHVGWAPDPYGQPLLEGCKEAAVATVYASATMRIEVYLCADHATRLVGIMRNPRRKLAPSEADR